MGEVPPLTPTHPHHTPTTHHTTADGFHAFATLSNLNSLSLTRVEGASLIGECARVTTSPPWCNLGVTLADPAGQARGVPGHASSRIAGDSR